VLRHDDRSAGLTSARVDAALTRGPIDGHRFRTAVIDEEPRVAVVRADHPLARRRRIDLLDLADGALVVTTVGTTRPDLWPEHRRPSVATEVTTIDDWLVAIAAGTGFGVSVASTAVLHPFPDVRYVPLDGVAPVPLMLAWPRQSPHPAVKELVRIATAIDAWRR
jgi:DNA-binding transcriptional LysR family regulator